MKEKTTTLRNPMLQSSTKAQLLVPYVTITVPGESATVQSQSEDKIYHVNIKENTCECPEFKYRGNHCKHLQAVDLKIAQAEYISEQGRENTQGLIRKDLLLEGVN